MGKIAAIDLGSNNFRLLAADESSPGRFSELLLLNRIVRAGQGIGSGGVVAREALVRVKTCLTEFSEALDALGIEKRIAALTAAGRDMKGGSVYADLAREILKAEVIIPEGVDEARLAFLGAVGMLGESEHGLTMLDIGGGSTEIAWNADGESRFESLKLGVVRLTEEVRPPHPLGESGFLALHAKAQAVIGKSECAVSGHIPEGGLVITAGTALTLAAHLSGLPIKDTRALTGISAELSDVREFASLLSSLELTEIRALKAIAGGREDVIAAGIAILCAFMEATGFKSCRISDGGMAEGLLFSNSSGGSGKIAYKAKDVV